MSRRLVLTLVGALIVIGVGLAAMTASGAPRFLSVLQGMTGLIALGVGAGVAIWRPQARSPGALIAALVALGLLASVWFHPGLEGVHRWIALGPIQMQPAGVALPVIVWFAAGRGDRIIGPTMLAVAALVCALQPDPQAAGALLATGIAVLLLHHPNPIWIAAVAVVLLATLVAAFAPPLAPVAYVEEVLPGSFAVAWPFGLVAALGLAAVPALVLASSPGRRSPSAAALAALWTGLAAASLSQLYPTPVIGFGLSWVLGWGLSLGLASDDARRAS